MGIRTEILLGLKALRRVLRLCGHGDAEGDDHDGFQGENGHEEVLGEVDMGDIAPDGLQGKLTHHWPGRKWGKLFSLPPSLIPNK